MITVSISKCCRVEVPEANDEAGVIWLCPQCKNECEVEEVCADCLGTGEVTTMEQVYAGEPHTAPIGTQKCICQLKNDDE